ncbi:unnamed protein product [Cuscuta campestris]|nr:unnamed protein product [Cuscuta campestris]
MLLRWRRKATHPVPADVPDGHVAVCVGKSCRRFVVPASHLNHPVFHKLLAQAEEEYGFAHQGPLSIPCHVSVFEETLRFVKADLFRRRCGGGGGLVRDEDVFVESRPMMLQMC